MDWGEAEPTSDVFPDWVTTGSLWSFEYCRNCLRDMRDDGRRTTEPESVWPYLSIQHRVYLEVSEEDVRIEEGSEAARDCSAGTWLARFEEKRLASISLGCIDDKI